MNAQRKLMHRYLVERTFPEGLQVPINAEGRRTCSGVVAVNAESDVTWIQSFVGPDHRKTFCIYDGPSPEAIRKAAAQNGLPVDTITPVTVLDPYFYVGA